MNISGTIILGVISGVITSAFIFLFIQIFYKIILPWYKDMIYSGIDISGFWEEVIDKSNSDHMKLELKQKERKVMGVATLTPNVENTNTNTLILSIEGHLQDGYLLLILKNKDRRRPSLSTYLLKINGGGKKLTGHLSWVGATDGNTYSKNITLIRV